MFCLITTEYMHLFYRVDKQKAWSLNHLHIMLKHITVQPRTKLKLILS